MAAIALLPPELLYITLEHVHPWYVWTLARTYPIVWRTWDEGAWRCIVQRYFKDVKRKRKCCKTWRQTFLWLIHRRCFLCHYQHPKRKTYPHPYDGTRYVHYDCLAPNWSRARYGDKSYYSLSRMSKCADIAGRGSYTAFQRWASTFRKWRLVDVQNWAGAIYCYKMTHRRFPLHLQPIGLCKNVCSSCSGALSAETSFCVSLASFDVFGPDIALYTLITDQPVPRVERE